MVAVLVARFERPPEITSIVRAALAGDILYLALPEAPARGPHVLQLFVGDALVASVSAELVGSGRGGEYPLRMGLIDPRHASDLEPLAAGRSAAPSVPVDPVGKEAGEERVVVGSAPALAQASRRSVRSAGAFAAGLATLADRDASDDTLSSRTSEERAALADDRTLTSRAPLPPRPKGDLLEDEPGPVSSVGGEVLATTVFDPDAPGSGVPAPAPTPAPARPGRAADFFSDDESQTLPGQSTREPGLGAVSWNVRIAPTRKDPLCGRAIGGGKYVLESVIGTGAIGIVFKASHRDLGRTVAIKVLNPRYRDDAALLQVFRAEARAASQLEHPNLARVYDYGQEPDGLVYIVMEYLSGYTLGSVLEARRKLTPSRAIDVMVQVCAALSAAHEHDIVHRDVKPDNIVLVPAQDDEGRPVEIVKVCDFGIAALGRTRTEEGTAVGTPEYMAPEQTTGLAVTPSADVYACGVVLYEMLVGEVPFTADQAYRIMMKHRSEAPRAPSFLEPGISSALESVILRCMEKRPVDRFQTARELRVALRKIIPSDSRP